MTSLPRSAVASLDAPAAPASLPRPSPTKGKGAENETLDDALNNKLAWLTGRTWGRLHYFAGIGDAEWAVWWEADSDPGYLHNALTAACGRTVLTTLPGIFSRMGMPRCSGCCRALGIPDGNGAPLNDHGLDALRRSMTDPGSGPGTPEEGDE